MTAPGPRPQAGRGRRGARSTSVRLKGIGVHLDAALQILGLNLEDGGVTLGCGVEAEAVIQR